jgi:hypothetical protein
VLAGILKKYVGFMPLSKEKKLIVPDEVAMNKIYCYAGTK